MANMGSEGPAVADFLGRAMDYLLNDARHALRWQHVAIAFKFGASKAVLQSVVDSEFLLAWINLDKHTYRMKPGKKHGREKFNSPFEHFWTGMSMGYDVGLQPGTLR